MQISNGIYQDATRIVPFHELAQPVQDNSNLVSRGTKRPVTNKLPLSDLQVKQFNQLRTEPSSMHSIGSSF